MARAALLLLRPAYPGGVAEANIHTREWFAVEGIHVCPSNKWLKHYAAGLRHALEQYSLVD